MEHEYNPGRYQLRLDEEITVDNFAGGGGASTGIEMATGRPVTIAINHDPDAIAMHQINHPYTEHYCESVWDINPAEVCRGRKVGLMWLSPDCKHFSRAKGGKPVSKNVRGLAWIALRWAATVKPRVIILENVPEFQTWGRLAPDGKPDTRYTGETFRSFIRALERHGYEVQWQELKACDYGAPTIRRRLFLIARCDGEPIVFPKPTHGSGAGLTPYRTAAECIDWSIPAKSIFEREKPLAENTLRRIARGIQKFVIDNPNPFIVTVNHGGDCFRGQEINEPLNTVTAKNGYGIVTPMLIPIGYGERKGQPPRANSVEEPLGTVVSSGKHYLVTPTIMSNNTGNIGASVETPLPTVTTGNRNYVIAPTLIQYHSETANDDVRGQELTKPLMTVDTSPRYALSVIHIMKNYGGGYKGSGSAADKPLGTITAVDHNELVLTSIQPDCGAHHAEVQAFLVKYFSSGTAKPVDKPLDTITTKDRFGLVTIHGEDYIITDIRMRMLTPRELYRAQGFPDDYIIDFDVNGKQYPRSAQIARCGNAVPPPFAEALVRANLPEMCGKKYSLMAELKEDIAI